MNIPKVSIDSKKKDPLKVIPVFNTRMEVILKLVKVYM